MNRTARWVIGIVILLAAAGVTAGLSGIDGGGGYSGLSPRFLPGVVATGLALCGVLLLAGGPSSPDASPDAPFAGRGAVVWMLGGLIVHMLLIRWIGFVAASVLLLTCVARGHGSRRPGRDALVGLLLSLPVWWLFAKGLGLSLPLLPLLGL
jgi:putative tricarboxylic transport membrane protein